VNPGSQISRDHLNGALMNTRGNVQLTGGAMGSLTLRYGIRDGEKILTKYVLLIHWVLGRRWRLAV